MTFEHHTFFLKNNVTFVIIYPCSVCIKPVCLSSKERLISEEYPSELFWVMKGNRHYGFKLKKKVLQKCTIQYKSSEAILLCNDHKSLTSKLQSVEIVHESDLFCLVDWENRFIEKIRLTRRFTRFTQQSDTRGDVKSFFFFFSHTNLSYGFRKLSCFLRPFWSVQFLFIFIIWKQQQLGCSLQIFSFVFHGRKWVIRVWNVMTESKWWFLFFFG